MSDHSSSVFNNSCVKLPRNPKSNQPLPVYEQKLLNQLRNEATQQFNLNINSMSNKEKQNKTSSVKSFIEFYDSIPEYDDVNHLSNREFYRKIEMLKEKQKTYCDSIQHENKCNKITEWVENYSDFSASNKKKPAIKPFCVTPILSKSSNKLNKNAEDGDSVSFSDKEALKPPSRRSVRIETPLSRDEEATPSDSFRRRPKSRFPSAGSRQDDWDDLSTIDDFKALELLAEENISQSKSAPSSPAKSKQSVGWKDSITIPKPFEMTVRDEENKIIDELLPKGKEVVAEKPEMFKAHSIPIESQIPLFDKLMADQERKNHVVRERSKAILQSQMRPFSFTKRDEELQKLTKNFSKSSPSLFFDESPLLPKPKKFKAKPIPRNLFSNYIYKKMHEDEFYRALQKKIRSEEMLRAASLPPSMERRERTRPKYDVCPRSYRDLFEKQSSGSDTKKKKNYYEFEFEKELEELKNEFLSTRTKSKSKKKKSSSSSGCSSATRTVSSLDLRSINRSNLAAVLRVQSARKRLELDMCQKLEEAKIKEESRWREKLMRKKPVWQTLAYSHEEDLAMRLQLRRDEEKLRSEEHKLRMQLMLGRVNQQPTLFERQSSQLQLPTSSKHELLQKFYGEKNNVKRSVSDLSELRMKDAAIQALLDEDLDEESSASTNNTKESMREHKEKCESLNSEEN